MYYCAQDIIEYLISSIGGSTQDSSHRVLRQAAHHGYRDVVYARDWMYHSTEMTLPDPVSGTDNKVYLLPAGVRNLDAVVPPDRALRTCYVTPQEYQRLEAYPSSYGDTIYYTVMRRASVPGQYQLMFAGKPTSVDPTKTYLLSYRRAPEPLRYMGYEPESRNNSLNATNAAGKVKRYGTAANFPEGPSGIHPYTAEEILGVTGSMIGTAPASAKTAVSDLLDVNESMFSAVLSGAEVWLARMQGRNAEGALTLHARDMRMAMEADAVAPMSGRRSTTIRQPEGIHIPYSGTSSTAREAGYYSPSGPDTGT